MLIFAADIGATNSRFALFEADPAQPRLPLLTLIREQWLRGADYTSFTDALRALYSEGDATLPLLRPNERPDTVVIAPAGPIIRDNDGECCQISNLPWRITSSEAAAVLGTNKVRLINDFAAQAYACLTPESVDAVPVLEGAAVQGSPLAVTGAGTGFGLALLLNAPPLFSGRESAQGDPLAPLRRAVVLPSEGGHAEFPFVGEKEREYARFAARRFSSERLIGDAVVSGSGLARLFTFITGQDIHPHEAAERAAEHPEVMELYARFYARACRIFVLQTLALGGLCITGGMALRLPVLQHPAFAEEFHASAAQRHLLERVPVYHIRKPQAGMWGAGLFALLQA